MFGDHRGDGLFNELFNLSYYIDKIPHGIGDKQIAGVGATTLEIDSERAPLNPIYMGYYGGFPK